MFAAAQKSITARNNRLGMTILPAANRCDHIVLSMSCKSAADKRRVAEELIKTFKTTGKQPSSFDFRGLDLSGADLRGLPLRALGSTALRQMNLTGANLSGQNLSGLDLRGARMDRAVMNGVTLDGSDLSNARMNGARINNSSMQDVKALGADMNNAAVRFTQLSGDFTGLQMNKGLVENCDMGKAYFNNAKMNNVTMQNVAAKDAVSYVGAEMNNAFVHGDHRGSNFATAQLDNAALMGRFENATFTNASVENLKTKDASTDAHAFDRVMVATDKAARVAYLSKQAALRAMGVMAQPGRGRRMVRTAMALAC